MKKLISRVYNAAARVFERISRDRVNVYAAGASYYIVVSFVPFAMLVITLLRYLLPSGDNGEALLSNLSQFLSDDIYELIAGVVGELYNTPKTSVLSVSAVAMLWSASRGVKSISLGIKSVYCSRDPDAHVNSSFSDTAKAILLSVAGTATLIAVLLFTAVLIFFGDTVADFLEGKLSLLARIMRALFSQRVAIFCAMLLLTFLLAYRFFSRSGMRLLSHLPGAMSSTAACLIFTWGYSIYINNFAVYSYVYGSLGAVILLMLWLYSCMFILLLGAEINVWISESRVSRRPA